MELKQINIYGECEFVNEKVVAKNAPRCKKVVAKNAKLKNKIKILYRLYEQLYEQQNISFLDNRTVIIKNNIIAYPDERQAEPIELIKLNIIDDIDKRIKKMEQILND